MYPFVFSALLLAANAFGKYPVIAETNVAMKTRDEVTLRADIYRPDAPGKFPVILERTPYDKRNWVNDGLDVAAQGYIFIMQDVRGRYASEGDWYPYKYESQDGYDTVEWAATLPYSNGKVGMLGGSYMGMTQMLAAIAAPPHLVAIMPIVTPSNLQSYQGGAFEQLLSQAWCSMVASDTLRREVETVSQPSHWDMMRPPVNYPVLESIPPTSLAKYYFDWLAHPSYDEYWKGTSFEEHFAQIRVPALHVAGWYDIFQDGSLRDYMGIRSHGGSEAALRGQRLVITVGGHAGFGQKVGELDFGKNSALDTLALGLRWYDYMLKGIDNGMAREKPVRFFVMGKNVWREEDNWPPPEARTCSYYLHSNGRANSLSGDGVLTLTRPASEPADKYLYDPGNPVPTDGGQIAGDSGRFPPGPRDQQAVERRTDVLVYSTPPLESDLEVTGPVALDLWAKTTAADTDFTAKLVDVWPNGFAQNLTDGILRARYRASMEKPAFMHPWQVYELTINLWSTSNVYLAGHKLRLEVSSSNFPRFDRNTNTGESPESATRQITATNVVYHDRDHPSRLVVSVMP